MLQCVDATLCSSADASFSRMTVDTMPSEPIHGFDEAPIVQCFPGWYLPGWPWNCGLRERMLDVPKGVPRRMTPEGDFSASNRHAPSLADPVAWTEAPLHAIDRKQAGADIAVLP
jgi:hypothetical protein